MSAVPGRSPDWLLTTVTAVRELMINRLEAAAADPGTKREMEMALEELDVMWEELQGQAALLLRENERYAQFFEFAPDAYLITDAGCSIREANQAALELLKAPLDEVAGRSLSAFIAPADRVAFFTRSAGLMFGAAGFPPAWRSRLQTLDGAGLEVEFAVRTIPLKKSGIGGICWLLRPLA
jgi:PAS domain S-box-containing protein